MLKNSELRSVAIDLNADLGEGGADDDAILACVSSVNIACGGHAGDLASMTTAVAAAMRHGVAIGAHPSFPDRENFGRTEMSLAPDVLRAELVAQVTALKNVVDAAGGQLCHVKPHGALYNQAARDSVLAQVVVDAIAAVDADLRVVGLADSTLINVAKRAGMTTAAEVFADRRYDAQKKLISRSMPNACIEDIDEALRQVLLFVEKKQVLSLDGSLLDITADTICLHGDGKHALALAVLIRQTLEKNQIRVRAPANKARNKDHRKPV
jgi:UPF0271 protein